MSPPPIHLFLCPNPPLFDVSIMIVLERRTLPKDQTRTKGNALKRFALRRQTQLRLLYREQKGVYPRRGRPRRQGDL